MIGCTILHCDWPIHLRLCNSSNACPPLPRCLSVSVLQRYSLCVRAVGPVSVRSRAMAGKTLIHLSNWEPFPLSAIYLWKLSVYKHFSTPAPLFFHCSFSSSLFLSHLSSFSPPPLSLCHPSPFSCENVYHPSSLSLTPSTAFSLILLSPFYLHPTLLFLSPLPSTSPHLFTLPSFILTPSFSPSLPLRSLSHSHLSSLVQSLFVSLLPLSVSSVRGRRDCSILCR